MTINNWYIVNNIDSIDSPALLVYSDRIKENIELVKKEVGDCNRLRPHVKTNKMAEVCKMMMDADISKFKCATIAEAEMLAICQAPDVLLAYQPVAAKVGRLLNLVKAYPATHFACLADNRLSVNEIEVRCREEGLKLDVYIDVNVGMNRTGIQPEGALALASKIKESNSLHLAGLHCYDGHIHDEDIAQRQKASDVAYAEAKKVFDQLKPIFSHPLSIVMGGTPTYAMHAKREKTECSPGTFVFWDWGYKHMLTEMPFRYAAVVLSRVISIINEHHICIDLGHKSVAAENPLPRVHFLNAPDAKPIAQSEEHLVLEVANAGDYTIGMPLYGVPVHICPTVALYDRAFVIENNKAGTHWKVVARDRYIKY